MTPDAPAPAHDTRTPASMSMIGPVSQLKGVGPRLAERLERLGIRSAQDVLFHLPARYQDRTRITPIGALRVGDEVVIEGEVQLTELRYGKRPALLSRIPAGPGRPPPRPPPPPAPPRAAPPSGVRLHCNGEVRKGPATLEMVNPEYRAVSANMVGEEDAAETLTPIYPTTEGLHQISLRNLTDQALARLEHDEGGIEEWLPVEILRALRLPDLASALRYVHRPPVDAPVEELIAGRHPAQQRLAFEELLAHHLSLRQLRVRVERHRAPMLQASGRLFITLLTNLPFQLTDAQQRVIHEINADMRRAHPMQRLVQGDVGSGKTLVAAAAALTAVESGFQAAVMAPTELLAEQHLRNFSAWLAPLGVRIDSFVGKLKTKERAAAMARRASGETQVAGGTHALFQDGVAFAKLGLVVIDEQHRFGVHQRLALWEKGNDGGRYPHQLIMTATPIPRTLAMTAYADLDVSVIDELPPGRVPVETVVVPGSRRDEVVQRVRLACREGRQVYWVCTLIEESEVLQCEAAQDAAVVLAEALPGLRVTNDGFEIARRDLEIRGPGEVLGTRQSGLMQLKIADLIRDQHLLPRVEQAADMLLSTYPNAVEPLIRRWVGTKSVYGEV